MASLADLRSRLRLLLGDDAAEGYLWSDAALDLHLNDAIRGYGRLFPRQRETTVATVAGQREYDLPADCLTVVRAEVVGTNGNTPLREVGDGFGTGYELYGGKLILLPTPSEAGESIAVRYLAPHAGLVSDADLSTVPEADEDLLLAFACARALQGLASEEAKRQSFEQRAGQSAEAVGALYWHQYEAGVRGRGSGVRVSRLVAD